MKTKQHDLAVGLEVSDDPLGIILALLRSVLSEPSIDQSEDMFTPDGEGYYAPDIMSAYRVRELEDLPEYMWENPPMNFAQNEVWIIQRTRYGGGGALLITGEELRHLVKEGKKLWVEFIAVPSNTLGALKERYSEREKLK